MSEDKVSLAELDGERVGLIWELFGGKECTVTEVIDHKTLNAKIGSRATVGKVVRQLADLGIIEAPDRGKKNSHAVGGKLHKLVFPKAAPKIPEKPKPEPKAKPVKEKKAKVEKTPLTKLAAKTNPKPVPIPPK